MEGIIGKAGGRAWGLSPLSPHLVFPDLEALQTPLLVFYGDFLTQS